MSNKINASLKNQMQNATLTDLKIYYDMKSPLLDLPIQFTFY